jgi:hypothetical protein
MPNLRFVSLLCHQPDDIGEDDTGLDIVREDEPYLMVGHKKVWNGRMGIGEVEDLSGVESIPFKETIRVELWDRDSGYVLDRDDPLGNITIHASQIGREASHQFKRRKARYTLTYKVI